MDEEKRIIFQNDEINELLIQNEMFLTFWLRTENKYFNVDTDVAELEVFKKELKTKFVPNKDQLISGRFSNWYFLDGALSRQQSSGGKSSDSNSYYQFENLFQLTNLDGLKLKDTNDMELFVNHQSLHNNHQKLATWKGRVLTMKKMAGTMISWLEFFVADLEKKIELI